MADYVGSTAGILDYCGRSEAREFIVVTEAGILAEMNRLYPDKRFIPAPPDDETCGCNNCFYMKMVTLERIAAAVRGDPEAVNRVLDHYSGYIAALSMRRGYDQNGNPCLAVDEEIRRRAERSIRNMIAIQ